MTAASEKWIRECKENARVLRRVSEDSPRVPFDLAVKLKDLAATYDAVVRTHA